MAIAAAQEEFTHDQIKREAERLIGFLERVGFNYEKCALIAPITLEINKLKREQDAVILAHSYQTPDIIYGIADFIGDSYFLSKKAAETKASKIVFCGVKFMAETAKILNPEKRVFLPSIHAGCSLADSITGEDVRKLKAQYPGRPAVCYINTTADVKAECDSCVTSGNALKVLNSFESDEIIFVPDKLMLTNLQKLTSKKLIGWNGTCIVHDKFDVSKLNFFRTQHKGLRVLAHSECTPEVAKESDFVGGTEGMINQVKNFDAPAYMLITECGLNDRMKVEFPEKEFIGMCGLCPFMKMNTLPLILKTLKNPDAIQEIILDSDMITRARKSLDNMFEITEAHALAT